MTAFRCLPVVSRCARRLSMFLTVAAVTAACVAGASAVAMPSSAAVHAPAARPALVITLGIHDGAVNLCDKNGTQTTAPTGTELAAAVSSFTNRYWKALKVFTVRFSPPWDIAYHHDKTPAANEELAVIQDCFNAWLAGVAQTGARPEVAFKPDPNFKSPDGRFVGVPDIQTYRTAVDAFISEYSDAADTDGRARVQIISPWGEPDFSGTGNSRIFMSAGGHLFADPNCHGSGTAKTCGPMLAASMWQVVHADCAQCTLPGQTAGSGVIAGDFTSAGGLETGSGKGLTSTYLYVYAKHLGGNRPVVWALHPYTDIENFEAADAVGNPAPALSGTLVGRFARDLDTIGYHQHTQIWLNEISAFQYYNMKGHYTGWNPKVQAAAGRYLLTELPQAAGGAGEPTVTRAYYLNFQAAGGPRDTSDANTRWALVLNGGNDPQQIYYTFANR